MTLEPILYLLHQGKVHVSGWLSDAFSLKHAFSATFTSNYVLKYVHGWVISFYH